MSGRETLAALQRAGFQVYRQAGSHVTMHQVDERRTVTVPLHAGKALKLGTLNTILKGAELFVADFVELLRK